MGVWANVRAEAEGFAEAYAAAPEPEIGWDVFGARRMMRKLGHLLLREHTEPRALALAVFVGVMIGASPFYIFHTLLVLVFAFALRLNKLAVWVASNISMPLFAPPLTLASMQVGNYLMKGVWLPLTVAGMKDLLASLGGFELGLDLWIAWLVGSLPVGAVLGAMLGGATWWVAREREKARGEDRGAA